MKPNNKKPNNKKPNNKKPNNKKPNYIKPNYIVIPLVAFLVALLGSWFTSVGMDWYKMLSLPIWAPSGSSLGTVWAMIFILSTVSALIVWNRTPHDAHFGWIVFLFLLNAFLNVFWSYLFFNQHQIGGAAWEAEFLSFSAIVLLILVFPVSFRAFFLLAPYAFWAVFITYLTYIVGLP